MREKLNHSLAIGVFLIGIFSANISQAQLYWNPTNGLGGTGSWTTSANVWSTNSAGGGTLKSSTTTTTNIYNFSGPAGTVTQGNNFTMAGMNWLTTGYTLTSASIVTNTATTATSAGTNSITLANNINLNITGAGFTFRALNMTGGTGSTLTLTNASGATTTVIFGTSSGTGGRTNSVNTIIAGAGTIVLGTDASSGFVQAGNITNNSTGMLVITNSTSGTLTVSGAISGSGAVTLANGSGGAVTVSGGISGSRAVTLTNASSGTVTVSGAISGSEAVTLANAGSGTVTVSGAISGTNAVTLANAGTGRAVLAGANTYSGGTTISANGGQIVASNNAAFGTGTITVGGVTNTIKSASTTIANAVAIGTGTTLKLEGLTSGSDTSTWSGVISGAGGIYYVLSDQGLFLTGTNSSFGGGINIGSSGKLTVNSLGMAGANSSIGTNGTITLSSASGTSGGTDINWTGAADETSDKNFALTTASSATSAGVRIYAKGATNSSLTLNGNIDSTGISNKVITLAGYNTNTLRMNGLINETAGYTNSVVVGRDGSGNVILNGTNTFSGAVTITQQTVGQYTWLQTTNIGNSGAASALGKNGTINIGSTNDTAFTILKYTGTGETSDKVINLAGTLGGATLDQSGTGNLKFTSAITGTGVGAKTVRLDGSSAGTGELSGSLTNAGGNIISVSKSGTGTWALSASNSYSGGTTISGGTLQARNANALGTGAVTVGSDGTLNVATVAVANTVKNSGTISIGAGGTLSASTMAPDAGGQGSLVLGGTSGSLAQFNSTVGIGTSSASNVLTLGNLTMNGNSVFSLQEIYTQVSAATVTFAGTGNSIGLNGKSNLWGANTYTLLSGTGMSGADSNLLLDLGAGDTVALGSSLLVGLKTYSFSQSGTALTMGITTAAVANQVWDSSVSSGAWSTTAQNWLTDGTGTAVAFNSGDNAALNSTATIAVDAGGISAGAVTLTNSAATVNLTGGSLTAGTLDKSGGDLVLANGANSFSGIVNSAGTLTSTGTLTTTAEGIQATGGQVNLNGTNNISGALRVNGGDVSVGTAATLSSQSIVVSSGALALGTNASNGTLTISGGSITGAGTLTNTSVAASGGTIEASLAGTGGLTKTGASDFNLNNSANSFTGGVTVSAGKLSAGVANNLSGQAVTVNGGTLDIGAFNNTATSVDLQSGSITGTTGALTAPVTANVASGVTASVGAGLTGNSSLTKNGTGTLTLSGSNSYTGDTAVNFGTLETVGNDRLADSSAVTLATGTTLKLGGNETVASVASTSTIATLNLQGNTLNLGGTGLSFTNAALTTGTGGSLVKNGSGLLYLNNSNNTYSGGFTLNSGEVAFTSSGIAGVNTVFGTGTVSLNGGTIRSSSASSGRTIYNNVALNGAVQFGDTFSALSSMTVSTNVAGNATTLLGNSTISTYSYTLWEQGISGDFRLTKDGGGAATNNYLSLRGSNNISGVTVNSGILGYKNRNALGTGTLILADGVVVGQDGLINNTGLTGNDQTDRAIANNIQLNGNVTFGLGGTGNYLGGNMDLNGAARTITLGNTTYQYGAVTNGGLVIDNGTATGNRTFALFASNNYSGGTIVRTNAILEVGNDNALGTSDLTFTNTTGSGSSKFTASTILTSASQLRTVTNNINLAGGMNVTVDAVASAQSPTGTAVTVSLNTTLLGAITGSGGLTKSSANTLTLSGNNSYTGGTTVSAGTLIGTTASLQGAITNNSVVIFDQSSDGTYGGSMRGTGTLTKTNSGTLILSGNNSYSGLTTVTAGTLTLSGNNSTASGGVTLTAGTLNVNSANALGSGTLTLTAGTTLGNTSGGAVVNAVNNAVTWGGDFTFGTAGSTSLSNLNLGAGTVTASTSRGVTFAGTGTKLTIGALNITSTSSGRTITATGAGNTLEMGGMTLSANTTPVTVTLAGTANIGVTGAILNGTTPGNGLTVASTGTTTFSGNNAYTGITTMNASGGTLNLTGNNSSATGGTFLTTGTLNINNANALSTGLLELSAVTGTAYGSSIINNTSGTALTFSGLSGVKWSGVALTSGINSGIQFGTNNSTSANNMDFGTGLVTASTDRAMNIAGTGVTISMGTLTTSGTGASYDFTIDGAGNTLDLDGWRISGATTPTQAAQHKIKSSANVTIGAIENGTGSFANGVGFNSDGVIRLTGNNTYTGATEFVGSGTNIISGNNSAAVGNVKIAGGTGTGKKPVVRLDSANAISSSSSLLGASSIDQIGTLEIGVASDIVLNSFGIATSDGNNMIFKNSSGTQRSLTFTNANNYITLSSSTTGSKKLDNQSANLNVVFDGDIDIGSSANDAVTFAGAGSFRVNGAVTNGSLTGVRGLTKAGVGTLTLAGAGNNYNGATSVDVGTLLLTNSATLTGSTALTVSTSGYTDSSSSGRTVNATLNLASGSTLLGNSTTTVYSGGNLIMNGTAGAVVVETNGLVGGSGTVGAFTLKSGAFLAPGNSPGILTAASATWEAGSTYTWEINSNASDAAAGDNWDLFSASGALDMSALSSAATMNLVLASLSGFDLTSSINRTWVIAQAGSLLGTGGTVLTTGTNVSDYFNINATAFSAGTPSLVTGWKIEVGTTGSGSSTLQTLNLMAIPEPSTGSLLGFGLAGLVVTRLLRRKQS